MHPRRTRSYRPTRGALLLGGAALVLTTATLGLAAFTLANPEDAEAAQPEAPVRTPGGETAPQPRRGHDTSPKPRAESKPAPIPDARPTAAGAAPPPGAVPVQPSPPGGLAGTAAAGGATGTASNSISARLSQNGAGTCTGVIDAEAAPTMVGVTEANTISQWSNVDPRDRHATSVFIGQRYGQNPAVPFGITGLIASPTANGRCDVTSVQVVSSPLPCARLRETLARTGRVLGEIAGMPVIGGGDRQTMLMPTATDTCVLVAFGSKFGG